MEIWKYNLEINGVNHISMKRNATILKLDVQNNEPKIWALVNPEENTEIVIFKIFATGITITKDELKVFEYIDSFIVSNGLYVFHVFKLID